MENKKKKEKRKKKNVLSNEEGKGRIHCVKVGFYFVYVK